ncbi:hypothetical protein QOZ80_7AG0553240 [Eleusine coracana subsp. coracana]|nr:hypothetical protein QOZ80_7AG0553240 [Eleusine coracana subsp. coracana]
MCIEQIGGEVAAKHAKFADAGGEDRLSALPDDVLVLILLRLYTADAARTSVLSHRWRRIWTLLPELRFDAAQNPHFLRSAISASEVPLHSLLVGTLDASPQSLAAWLPAAATRVSGKLVLVNLDQRSTTAGEEAEASQVELPCFEKANAIGLELGFLGLSVPPAGVFARLIDLYLHGVQFHSPGELEDFVSSPRCPCLQKLSIRNVRGLDSITIDSGTLLLLRLDHLHGVRKVTVVAPVLKDLSLVDCFLTDRNQPVVNISAPQLKFLNWVDA